jgi:hypothetical protein
LASITRRLTDETKREVEAKLLIDKQALAFLGISQTAQIEEINSIQKTNVREKLFEHAGLVLLVAVRTRSDGTKEYTFALTTPTTLALNRQFKPIPSGHCVRIVPFEVLDSVSKSSSQWLSSSRWLAEATLSSIPWSVAVQVMQRTTLTSDWNAYELPLDTEQSLYIVHRQKFVALQWIAFLTIVLVTCRKPLASPVILFALLIVFELTTRSVAPCYAGIPSGAFLGVLVSLGFIWIRLQIRPKASQPEHVSHSDSTECSISFVPTPLTLRSILFCVALTVLTMPSAAQTFTEPPKEPYRVFYPTNPQGQVVGDDVLLPFEFYKILLQNVESNKSSTAQRWSMTKAVYQGSLVRGASGHLECSDDFKVVYDVYLDSSGATIALPNLPNVPGKCLWNSKPIQPIWKDDAKNDTLSFLIENETPGKHTLEITLSPKVVLRGDDETSQIAFSIPKVLDSTLRLNVPSDAPPMNLGEALGTVTMNTALSPMFSAELGPTQQVVLSWIDTPSRSETLVNEVAQFFWIRARQSQIELETLFRDFSD